MAKKYKQPQNVGSIVLDNFDYLKKLARTKSDKKRHSLLNKANRDQLLSLVEISANILSNFNLTPKQKKRLQPYAGLVRKLARVRSEKAARKIVRQTGRGAILPALLAPILIEAASHLISKFTRGNGST